MDSTDTLTKAEVDALATWAASAQPSGMHIDEIIPGLDRSKWVAATIRALESLRTDSSDPLAVIACFPLNCSSKLDTRAPRWDEVLAVNSDEPPSLHRVSAEVAVAVDDCEEYRYPLTVPSVSTGAIYYRCFRPKLGIDNNWEFERAIYVHVPLLVAEHRGES